MSQMPSSSIPTFFEKFMDVFLSLSVGCECVGSNKYTIARAFRLVFSA
jgi:hypothetical protein